MIKRNKIDERLCCFFVIIMLNYIIIKFSCRIIHHRRQFLFAFFLYLFIKLNKTTWSLETNYKHSFVLIFLYHYVHFVQAFGIVLAVGLINFFFFSFSLLIYFREGGFFWKTDWINVIKFIKLQLFLLFW